MQCRPYLIIIALQAPLTSLSGGDSVLGEASQREEAVQVRRQCRDGGGAEAEEKLTGVL